MHAPPPASGVVEVLKTIDRELADKALRPYVWTATSQSVLDKVARGRNGLERVS
jgi:hypothetical protein